MTVTFTKVAGVSFIILSILRFTPVINVTGKWLLYISIAAFFLILYDLVQFVIERVLAKKDQKSNRILVSLRSLFIGLAVLAIIVLPNIKIDLSVKQVNALSDAFTLISLGIAITLIGFKAERDESILFIRKTAKENEIKEFLNSVEGVNIIRNYIQELSVENKQKMSEGRSE